MFLKDFSSSIKAYGQAFELAGKLKLWKYFFIPAIIGLFVGILIMIAAWYLSEPIGQKIGSYWPFDFWKEAMMSFSIFLGGVFVILIGAIIFKHAVMAFSAPFMTPVSEKIEMHITGKSLDQTDTSAEYIAALVRGIRINLRNLIIEMLITLPLIILSIIPLINIFTTFMLIYVQAYFAGFGNMDYTLERYCNYSETKIFVRNNKGIAVGNGLIFHLLLAIPVVGIMLALPLSTIAATTETLKKLKAG
ncbi:MAG: EI24 domain-containing protein [Crocinitomicaceae bacterium]|nr:EI24 domain-containing protein [Crocinitomicaceae bacterium]